MRKLFMHLSNRRAFQPNLYLLRNNQIASRPKLVSLNAPMIQRVHAQKPGCSACGHKVH